MGESGGGTRTEVWGRDSRGGREVGWGTWKCEREGEGGRLGIDAEWR